MWPESREFSSGLGTEPLIVQSDCLQVCWLLSHSLLYSEATAAVKCTSRFTMPSYMNVLRYSGLKLNT